jgi:ribosomal-protein-alanine N-acetyltransferase
MSGNTPRSAAGIPTRGLPTASYYAVKKGLPPSAGPVNLDIDEVCVTTATKTAKSATGVHAPQLRPVRADDLPALEVLDKAAFRELAYNKHHLQTFFNLYRRDWYVIDDNHEPCGYVLVGLTSDGTEAWLLGLAVDGDHQGRGLGRILMAKALEIFEQAKVRTAYITVRPDNAAAVHLYKAAEFHQDGEPREDFYGNNEPRAVLRRDFPTDRQAWNHRRTSNA